MDDMIRAFLHVANYRSRLKGGPIGKGLDHDSLKLKVASKCGDPKVSANAMKAYPRAIDLNTKDCVVEGFEFFGSTKCKLNLPPGVDCDSHRLDKVNYSIPQSHTRAKISCIEESLNSTKHSVAHPYWRQVAMLSSGTLQYCQVTLPKCVGQCMPIQGFFATPKSELANMAPLLQCTQG